LNRFVSFQFHLSAFDSELLPDDSVAVLGVANDGLAGFELPLRILVALVVPILRRRMSSELGSEIMLTPGQAGPIGESETK
jgi:hypothetical protein